MDMEKTEEFLDENVQEMEEKSEAEFPEPEFLLNEPFLTDLILLLDRMEKGGDAFSISLKEELLDILQMQGVEQIPVQELFDPRIHRAIRAVEEEGITSMMIKRVIRNGYRWNGKVVRAMEVGVAKPCRTTEAEQKDA